MVSRRIDHGDGECDDFRSSPDEAHQYFRVEGHALRDAVCTRHLQHRRDRVDAKPAHAVDVAEGERVDRHPEMRDPARDAAAARNGFVVNGFTGNEGFGLRLGKLQKITDAADVVLAIRIHLERMGETTRVRPGDPVENGGTLAAIGIAPQEFNPFDIRAYLRNLSGDLRRVAIVHDDDGQTFLHKSLHDVAQGTGMLVGRHDGAGSDGHSRPLTVPLATISPPLTYWKSSRRSRRTSEATRALPAASHAGT